MYEGTGMTPLHIYSADKKRVRRLCPYHKHLCFGDIREYYDGIYLFFDCGTRILGEYWMPPKQYKRLEVFKDGDHWEIFNRHSQTFFGKAKTKASIKRIAECHLKPGGTITWS